MSIAVLLTIPKIWKHPKCSSVGEWVRKQTNCGTFTQRNTTEQWKEGILIFFDTVDGTGLDWPKLNKPVNERQMPHDLTYKWHLMNKIN